MSRPNLMHTLLNGMFVVTATFAVTRCQPEQGGAWAENVPRTATPAPACAAPDQKLQAEVTTASGLDLTGTRDAIIKLMTKSGVKGTLGDVASGLDQMLVDAGATSVSALDAWRGGVAAVADNLPFDQVIAALQGFKALDCSAEAASTANAAATAANAAAALATLRASTDALKDATGLEIADAKVQVLRLKTLTVDPELSLTDAVDAVLAARDKLKAGVATLPLAISVVDASLSVSGATITEKVETTLANAAASGSQSSSDVTAIEAAAGVGSNGTVAAINALKTATGLSTLGGISTAIGSLTSATGADLATSTSAIGVLKTATGQSSLAAANAAIGALTTASGADLATTTTAIADLLTATGLADLGSVESDTAALLTASGSSLGDTRIAIATLKTVTGGADVGAAATAAVAARDGLVTSGTTLAAAVTSVNGLLGSSGTTHVRANAAYTALAMTSASGSASTSAALNAVGSAASVSARMSAFLDLFKSTSLVDNTTNGYAAPVGATAPTSFAALVGSLLDKSYTGNAMLGSTAGGAFTFVGGTFTSPLTKTFNGSDFSSSGSNLTVTIGGQTYSYTASGGSTTGPITLANGGQSLVVSAVGTYNLGSAAANASSLATDLNTFLPSGATLTAVLDCSTTTGIEALKTATGLNSLTAINTAVTAVGTASGVSLSTTASDINAIKATAGLGSLSAINTAIGSVNTASGTSLATVATDVGALKTTTGLTTLAAINTAASSLLTASGVNLAATTTAVTSIKSTTGGSDLTAAATAAVAARDGLVSSGTTLAAAVTSVNGLLGSSGTTYNRANAAYTALAMNSASAGAPNAAALDAVGNATSVNGRMSAFLDLFKTDSLAGNTNNGYALPVGSSAPASFAALARLMQDKSYTGTTLVGTGGPSMTFVSANFLTPVTKAFEGDDFSVNGNVISVDLGGRTFSYVTSSSDLNSGDYLTFVNGGQSFVLSLLDPIGSGNANNNADDLRNVLSSFFQYGATLNTALEFESTKTFLDQFQSNNGYAVQIGGPAPASLAALFAQMQPMSYAVTNLADTAGSDFYLLSTNFTGLFSQTFGSSPFTMFGPMIAITLGTDTYSYEMSTLNGYDHMKFVSGSQSFTLALNAGIPYNSAASVTTALNQYFVNGTKWSNILVPTSTATLLAASGVDVDTTATAMTRLKDVTGAADLDAAATAAEAARDGMVAGGTTLDAAVMSLYAQLGAAGTVYDRVVAQCSP